ncbi:MAG: GNAT family N-acetyltransferase [Verrucomicrobia bacterium]|nr:GNAT family N-acetyltransferase [Verrucomicrobiota bacterium]MBU4429558.1 GNAT family N-acetyltransferase [Verrucomicrobiota bacterium]MBU4498387.1 GNAT family N-acetyltransferase [Verrucomicrobiota bacterium]MCG2681842.1 GNAT family N-acetyltransferase [Kiritimatiellia bacterium]
MQQIEQYEIRLVRPEEKKAMDEMVSLAFSRNDFPANEGEIPSPLEVTPNRDYRAEYKHLPRADLVCLVEGKIVSRVCITNLDVRIEDVNLVMGAIGGVATHPSYRRRGYVVRLFEESKVYLRESGCDFSMLFTGTPHVYAKAGWALFPEYEWEVKMNEALPQADAGFLIRPFNDGDLNKIMHVYDVYNGDKIWARIRDKDCWTKKLESADQNRGKLKSAFLVAEKSGSLVAYLRYSEGNILEIGYLSESSRALRALIIHAANYCRKEGRALIKPLRLPNDPELMRYLEEIGGVKEEVKESMMLKLINLESFLGKMAPLLEKRLACSKLSKHGGEFALSCGNENIGLKVEDGRVSCSLEGGAGGQVSLPESDFFRLISGYAGIDQVHFAEKRTVSPGQLCLLETLFPEKKGKIVYWLLDRF